MKKLLMIAYHFPPHRGSSGIQRTLNFARSLPDFGWQPEVLTATLSAYEGGREAFRSPPGLPVHRALALDAKRHLAIMGRYPGFLARPDRWRSWWLPGTIKGLSLIANGRFDAIWSTFPIATAHRIGASLARLSGLPWIADLRDPMAHDGYPREPAQWKAYERIERRVFERAAAIVTVTPGCADYYRRRYPLAARRIHLIRNGAEAWPEPATPPPSENFVLLHSGLIYPWERDPEALFRALALLRERHATRTRRLRLVLRAPGSPDWLVALAHQHSVQDLVEILPATDHAAARREMSEAGALLVLQAANCALQIPAKLYEYARTRRPILSLCSPGSDTWTETLRLGGHCAELDQAEAIANRLAELIDHPERFARQPDTDPGYVERSASLAHLLDSLAPPHGISSSV